MPGLEGRVKYWHQPRDQVSIIEQVRAETGITFLPKHSQSRPRQKVHLSPVKPLLGSKRWHAASLFPHPLTLCASSVKFSPACSTMKPSLKMGQ